MLLCWWQWGEESHIVPLRSCEMAAFASVWMGHYRLANIAFIKSNTFEPHHDKTNKMTVRLAKTQISLGIFDVRMKKAWVLSYPLSAQRRLIRLGRYPAWSVFAWRTVILLVSSWGSSFAMLSWCCLHVRLAQVWTFIIKIKHYSKLLFLNVSTCTFQGLILKGL